MSNGKLASSILMQQYALQGRNLLAVCRLAVKSLIDKACLEVIDESSEELQNFCVVLEHILCHRLKPQQKWYGSNGVRSFWDYVRVACSDVTHNCLNNIKTLEKPRTSQGKGRAWLRMALMEKRLSEYLSAALQHSRLTRTFYSEGSVMLTDEVQVLTGVLLGLNAIDFSFDLRSEDLDQPFIPVINFTPYLKFVPNPEIEREDADLQELSEMSTSVVSDVFGDDDPTDTWPNRFSRLDDKYRLVVQQKGYLEELVRLRDSQISEIHIQKKKLIEALQHYENESRKDRQQLESVIIELQAQISQMKEERRNHGNRLSDVIVQYQSAPPSASVYRSDLKAQRQSSPGSTKLPASSHLEAVDTRSIVSSTSTGSAVSVPRKGDDSHSMVPLAGSFTSETSVKAGAATVHSNKEDTTVHSNKENATALSNKEDATVHSNTEDATMHGNKEDATAHSNKEDANMPSDKGSSAQADDVIKSAHFEGEEGSNKPKDTPGDLHSSLTPENAYGKSEEGGRGSEPAQEDVQMGESGTGDGDGQETVET